MIESFDEFLGSERKWPNNAYVHFEGFNFLYIRKGPRFLNRIRYDKVVDLANCEVSEQKKGTFTKLIGHIRQHYSDHLIYVENVLNESFADNLPRLGFIKVLKVEPPCFYMLPQKE